MPPTGDTNGSGHQQTDDSNNGTSMDVDLLSLQKKLLVARQREQQQQQLGLRQNQLDTAALTALSSLDMAAALNQASMLQMVVAAQQQQQQPSMQPMIQTMFSPQDQQNDSQAPKVEVQAQPFGITSDQMMTNTISQTTLLCESIMKKSITELKGANPIALVKLRDQSRQLFRVLDDVVVKVTPFTKYSRQTVKVVIDKFRQYKFQKMSALCDYNLVPILQRQVMEALRAERGDIALDMLAEILGFFLKYGNTLSDDFGSGKEFMDEWIKCALGALDTVPDTWDDTEVAEELLVAMGECMRYRTNGGFFDVQEQLEALVEGYESDYDYGGEVPLEPPDKRMRN
mmetsp:Transcript_24423/g.53252  ORF Transcript_24423/g.53252 Transcript_24423/m.53252 type:complete len:343 (-) Transcript_24423:372-1400(-)